MTANVAILSTLGNMVYIIFRFTAWQAQVANIVKRRSQLSLVGDHYPDGI
jgi:hypothetical protein